MLSLPQSLPSLSLSLRLSLRLSLHLPPSPPCMSFCFDDQAVARDHHTDVGTKKKTKLNKQLKNRHDPCQKHTIHVPG